MPISGTREAASEARAEQQRAKRAEHFKEMAKSQMGWSDDLLENWNGGSTESLVSLILPGLP